MKRTLTIYTLQEEKIKRIVDDLFTGILVPRVFKDETLDKTIHEYNLHKGEIAYKRSDFRKLKITLEVKVYGQPGI